MKNQQKKPATRLRTRFDGSGDAFPAGFLSRFRGLQAIAISEAEKGAPGNGCISGNDVTFFRNSYSESLDIAEKAWYSRSYP